MFLKRIGLHHFFSPLLAASIFAILENGFKNYPIFHTYPHWVLRFAFIWLCLLIVSRFVNYFFQKIMSLKDFRASYPLRLIITGVLGSLLLLPFFLWFSKSFNGEMHFLLSYIAPQKSAHYELLKRFFIIVLVAIPFWSLPNIGWYAYKKRLADIVIKKEMKKANACQVNPYKNFIYNTLTLSTPANIEYRHFTKLMSKTDIIAVTTNAKNEVLVYTDKETKILNGRAHFIINKIKNGGGIQIGENTWVKPSAVIEMKPSKNGYGLLLSNGQTLTLANLSSKAVFTKNFVEKTLDDQQRQRA